MKSQLDMDKIAAALGAKRRGKVSATGGYFGALQLLADIEARFRVPAGGGRPTDPRWTERHFNAHRELIRIMCVDAGDELKEAWQAINQHGGPAKQPAAMELLRRLPRVKLYNRETKASEEVVLTWRAAPDILKKYDKLEYARAWTAFFRNSYDEAKRLAN